MPLHNDSFLQACRGERPARTPIWLMRQAGRYMPEYRAIRSRVSFTELCRSPDLCAEVTLQPVDFLDVDAAILFSDILVVFDALGIDVRFEPSPVISTPVRTEADVNALRFGDPHDHLRYVFDAVRACKRALADRVPLIGFCGAPFTTLSYLVEGQTSREFERVKSMMFAAPALFGRLMENITTLLCEYLRGQVLAGADALQVFDSWAGALAPADYREHVLPHLARLVDFTRTLGVPLILFVRGNANLLAMVAELTSRPSGPELTSRPSGPELTSRPSGPELTSRPSGPELSSGPELPVLGVDWTIDLDRAIAITGPTRVVQGNLDPMILLGPADLVERKARACVAAGRAAKAHIFNLGHGISRHTDPAIAKHLIDVVHAA